MAFLAELSTQIEEKGILFDLTWVPRSQNQEADAITNGQVEWLTASLRIKVVLAELPFLILNELLDAGGEFYAGLGNANVEGEELRPQNKTLLKVRAPWD